MKIIYLALLIVLCSQVLEGQSSLLYNSTGSLRIDSTYRVKTEDLKYIMFYETESVFHQIYENVEYPKKCYENGVGGFVIARVSLNRKDLSISCIIESTTDERLGRSVIDAVYKSSLHLFKATRTEDDVVFYLPFKFEVKSDTFDRELERNGLIKIEKAFHKGRVYLL